MAHRESRRGSTTRSDCLIGYTGNIPVDLPPTRVDLASTYPCNFYPGIRSAGRLTDRYSRPTNQSDVKSRKI